MFFKTKQCVKKPQAQIICFLLFWLCQFYPLPLPISLWFIRIHSYGTVCTLKLDAIHH